MVTQDNRRIKENKLIRSGHLYAASEADRVKLSELVDMIIDFRTEMEMDEKPNLAIEGVEYLHMPIFEELVVGITREEKSDQQMMGSMIRAGFATIIALARMKYLSKSYKRGERNE